MVQAAPMMRKARRKKWLPAMSPVCGVMVWLQYCGQYRWATTPHTPTLYRCLVAVTQQAGKEALLRTAYATYKHSHTSHIFFSLFYIYIGFSSREEHPTLSLHKYSTVMTQLSLRPKNLMLSFMSYIKTQAQISAKACEDTPNPPVVCMLVHSVGT